MGIAKGEDWGAPGQLPPDAPIATSDLQLAQLVGKHDVVGVEEGDLARTLGIRKPYDRSTPKHLVPVDAIEIEVDDGSTYTAIAHVIVGHPLASAETVALMNAAFWRGRNIAPRAHPGDGRIDVVHLQLSASDRVKAWKRMATGTHVESDARREPPIGYDLNR